MRNDLSVYITRVNSTPILLISGCFFFFFSEAIFAQSGYSTPWKDTYPVSGIESLWQCLKEDGWTEAEKQVLAESAWHIKIHVDSLGQAKVADVLGIADAEMKQKIMAKTCLGPFVPRMMDGTALPAFYFLYHTARDQERTLKEGPEAYETFNIAVEIDDLAEISYRSMGIDFFAGAYVPIYAGKASPYLSPGVGGSFGLGIRFQRHYTFSAAVAFASHWVEREIPETRDVSVGASVGNFAAVFMLSRDIKFMRLSALGGLTELGISPADGDPKPRDEGSIYGFTTGLRLDVPVWSFMDKIGFRNGVAFRKTTDLDVMGGLRYNYYGYTNMRGWMIEAGINYRWQKRDVESLRLRNAFYGR